MTPGLPKRLSRSIDHLNFLKRTLEELTGFGTLAFELIQNADDTGNARRLRFDVRDEALWVEDDGGFTDCGDQDVGANRCKFYADDDGTPIADGHRCDFHSFRLLSGADKRLRDDTTGAFGIGFTAVYQITDRPEIISGDRHWIVDETAAEDDRIEQFMLDAPLPGTRIVLPWAFDPDSAFRQQAQVAPVPPGAPDHLLEQLDDVLGPASLFLRNLTCIELAQNGEVVRRVTRERDEDVVVIDDGGSAQTWRLVEREFEEEAEQVRQRHGTQIETPRRMVVALAIPDGFATEGRICSTLPTQTKLGVSWHVNAELYLTSDRRGLSMAAAHHAAWNASALQCAGELLAEELAELPGLLGAQELWASFERLRKTAAEENPDLVVESIGAMWSAIEDELAFHDLVLCSDDVWRSIGDVRFLISKDDDTALDLLNAIDIAAVSPSLRSRQNILLAVGVPLLSISDIVAALRAQGLDQTRPLDDLPETLAATGRMSGLWSQLQRMIERLRPSERDTVRETLEQAAVIPTIDGRLVPIDGAWSADAPTTQLITRVAPRVPLLAAEDLGGSASVFADLCDGLTPTAAIDELAAADLELDRESAHELVGWFASRDQELDDQDRQSLAALPIFPTPGGFRPLGDLDLPGSFDEPLGLARLVDAATAHEHRAFLERLGAAELDLVAYASRQIPQAFETDEVSDDQKRSVVLMLAQRRGELEDRTDVYAALARVALAECTDGTWRRSSDVYFDNELVRGILGDTVPHVKRPPDHPEAITDLHRWLGVADEPKPADVVRRAGQLGEVAGGVGRATARRIVEWLGASWPLRDPTAQIQFDGLRRLAWLPVHGDDELYRPTDVDLVFQEYLYASQAEFLDVPQPVQGRASEFLAWLGTNAAPSVQQVVMHLLHCAEHGEQPNSEVYRTLDLRANRDDLEPLRDAACLHINSTWRRPDEVYWGEHPFGHWRVRLGHDFPHRNLLDGLDVKDLPDHRDAIAVMRSISAEFSPTNSEVPEQDRAVLRECWRMCEAASGSDGLNVSTLRELGREKLVVDDQGVLVPPQLLYFEDLPGLADELPGIRTHVIRRPDGAWRAMRAAGVRDLSREATAEIVELGDRRDTIDIPALIQARESALARVIAPVRGSWRTVSGALDDLSWVTVSSLRIAWTLEAFGRTFPGTERAEDALWRVDDGAIYVVVDDVVWEAVAREIVRASVPDVEPSALALGIATALGARSVKAAHKALDSAGYPQLAPEFEIELSTYTATELDADDAPEADDAADVDDADATQSDDPGLEGEDKGIDGDEGQSGDGGADDETEADDEAEGADDSLRGDRQGGSDQDGAAGTGSGGGGSGQGAGGGGGSGTSDGTGTTGGSSDTGQSSGQSRNRLRSYVAAPGSTDRDADWDVAPRTAVDDAGIAAVVKHETDNDRHPDVQDHNNPGFDVISEFEDGEIARYIEVKSSSGHWDAFGVGISARQFTTAQRLAESFWLYVVEYALDPARRRIWRINDPANMITDFMFDDGWKGVAEDDPDSEPVMAPAPESNAEAGASSLDDLFRAAMESLSYRERRVVELRAQGRNSADVGRSFNISGERVRQIQMQVLKKLVAATGQDSNTCAERLGLPRRT